MADYVHHGADQERAEPPRQPAAIPPTGDATRDWIAGEREGEAFLMRVVRGQAAIGELAVRLGVDHDPKLAGLCGRVQRALQAHAREART